VVSIGLTILAALASYAPSRRAAKVNPIVASTEDFWRYFCSTFDTGCER
jgi:hypothetical protein